MEDYSCQEEAIGAVFVLRWYQLQGRPAILFWNLNWVLLLVPEERPSLLCVNITPITVSRVSAILNLQFHKTDGKELSELSGTQLGMSRAW